MSDERRGSGRTELTHARLLELLNYDTDTGVFTRKIGGSGTGNKVGYVAGSLTLYGYIRIMIDGKLYLAHRLAWFYVNGEWPGLQIDHINCIRSDNRLVNLRNATRSENCQNQRKAHSNNTTGFLGVSFNKAARKFTAHISLDGKISRLGYFPSPELAHAAYITAKRELHPTCTI